MASKQYEVIANHKVFGFAKGERFHADLSPEQEERKLGMTLALVREPEVRVRRSVVAVAKDVDGTQQVAASDGNDQKQRDVVVATDGDSVVALPPPKQQEK